MIAATMTGEPTTIQIEIFFARRFSMGPSFRFSEDGVVSIAFVC